MKDYDFKKDIFRIRKYFGLSQMAFANEVGVSRISLARWEAGSVSPSPEAVERVYSYAYANGLALSQAKADFFQEESRKQILLFHGTEATISGSVDPFHSVPPNDFGNGFYAGTNLNQAATWIAEKRKGSVYAFYFPIQSKLRSCRFETGREWMYAVLYFRGAFRGFEASEEVLEIARIVQESDYVIAPITDNQMYQILNSFAHNEITDEACFHALSATNLGMQYVFKSTKACSKLLPLDRIYLCDEEKRDYAFAKEAMTKQGLSKAQLALIEYRRKGKYFDELFTRIR